eukprot:scaffold280658_cov55-Attheya_sp.AAC.1
MEIQKSDFIHFGTELELVGLSGWIDERALANVRAKTPFSSERDGCELKINDPINDTATQGWGRFYFYRLDSVVIIVRYNTAYQFAVDDHLTEMSERGIQRRCQRCPMEGHGDEDESEEENEDEAIKFYLDCEFVHDGSLYRVTIISDTQVFVKCIHSANHIDAMRLLNNNDGEEEYFNDLAYIKEQIKCRLG